MDNNSSFRYYPQLSPNVFDRTIIKVNSTKIDDSALGVPCSLLEYNNIDGILLTKNLSKKLNSKRNYIAEVSSISRNVFELTLIEDPDEEKTLLKKFLLSKASVNFVYKFCRTKKINSVEFFENFIFAEKFLKTFQLNRDVSIYNIVKTIVESEDEINAKEYNISGFDTIKDFVGFYKEKNRKINIYNFEIHIKSAKSVKNINTFIQNSVEALESKFENSSVEVLLVKTPTYQFNVKCEDVEKEEVKTFLKNIVDENNSTNFISAGFLDQ